MYICTGVYVRNSVYMRIYGPIYRCMHVYDLMYAYRNRCANIYIQVKCGCVDLDIFICIYVCMHVDMYIWIRMYKSVCIRVYIFTDRDVYA